MSLYSTSSSLNSEFVSQPLERIRNILGNSSFQNSEISNIFKSILKNSDKCSLLVETIRLLWTSTSDVSHVLVTALLNHMLTLDDECSYVLFEELKILLEKEKIQQLNMMNILPVLVGNIRRLSDTFTGFIDPSGNRILLDNLVPFVRALREANALKDTEKALLIRRIIEFLSIVELEMCADLVRELLLICNKINFPHCLASIVNLFNDRSVSSSQLSQSSISDDNKRIIEIQTAVVRYCYQIAEWDRDFVKEILKFCRSKISVYSVTGFMCIILLKLAGHEYVKDQILEHLKTCIMDCFIDNKLYLESAFIRIYGGDYFDMDSLLLKSIKFCCFTEREQIADSLLELGFLLIKSGLPKSKVINLKANVVKKDDMLIGEYSNYDFNMSTDQKIGQAGIQIVIHVYKKLPSYRNVILDNILNFILKESHNVSVYVYLELFADLIALMPDEILTSIIEFQGQPIFDLFCFFERDVAISLVHAILPLIRYSHSFRDRLISVIMKNLLSGLTLARTNCVESALILLKYLKVMGSNTESLPDSEPVYLTQCSQFACTQIALCSKPLIVNDSFNEEICSQILSIIDECCRQYPSTKPIIYKGLVHVSERNYHFSGKVVLFLNEKLETILNIDIEKQKKNPFVMKNIVSSENPTNDVNEFIPTLLSCLSESVRFCRTNVLDANTESDDDCISLAICKAGQTVDVLIEYFTKYSFNDLWNDLDEIIHENTIIFEQLIEVYDVLMVHLICSESIEQELLHKLFKNRMTAIKSRGKSLDKKSSNKIEIFHSLSLSTLVKCMRYLLTILSKEVKDNMKNNAAGEMPPPSIVPRSNRRPAEVSVLELSMNVDESNIVVENELGKMLIYEQTSVYILDKIIMIVKKIGTSEFRITSRNRIDICGILSEVVRLTSNYYVTCLCSDVRTVSTHQRQVMHCCLTLYCSTLMKVIQFFSKSINAFLVGLSEMNEIYSVLQNKIRNQSSDEIFPSQGDLSMNFFLKFNKLILVRLFSLSVKRLYFNVEDLLNVTLSLAIYCGLEDARQTINVDSAYSSRINTIFLHNLSVWLIKILKTSKIEITQNTKESSQKIILTDSICKTIVNIWLLSSRFTVPNAASLADKLAGHVKAAIGPAIRNSESNQIFELVTNSSEVIPCLLNFISMIIDETDWLINKWKCRWIEIRNIKAVSNSQISLSSVSEELLENSLNPANEQGHHLIEQILVLCSTTMKLIQCEIKSVPRLQELVKLCSRIFTQLTAITKQFIQLYKTKLGTFSSNFEKLVRYAGSSFSLQISTFIVHVQNVEGSVQHTLKTGDKDKTSDELKLNETEIGTKKRAKFTKTLDNQVGKTDKELRLIPTLVFEIEQFQRYLIELQKISKVDLMSHVKTVISRDFRINMTALQESLNQNISMSLSDEDEAESMSASVDTENDKVESEDETQMSKASPPKKRPRTT